MRIPISTSDGTLVALSLLLLLPIQLLPRGLLQQRAQVLHAVFVCFLLLPAHVEAAADGGAELGVGHDLPPLIVFGIIDFSLEGGVSRNAAVVAADSVVLVIVPGVGDVAASLCNVATILCLWRLPPKLRERSMPAPSTPTVSISMMFAVCVTGEYMTTTCLLIVTFLGQAKEHAKVSP